jgi:hypothetical protein
MAKLNLDLTKVAPESSSMFSKVPAGKYVAVVAHSVFKDTKTGGAGLQLGFMIEEGEHTGKMIQDFVNIAGSSEKAVEIGLGRIRRIMEVQKRKSFKLDTDEQLISNVAFEIEVTLEQGEYDGKPTENSKVKKIMMIEGDAPKATTKATPKKEAAPVEEKELMPWDEGYKG